MGGRESELLAFAQRHLYNDDTVNNGHSFSVTPFSLVATLFLFHACSQLFSVASGLSGQCRTDAGGGLFGNKRQWRRPDG